MTRTALTVHSTSKEAGGSISNYLNDYRNVLSHLMIHFSCGYSRLNGVYYTDPKGAPRDGEGIIWYNWLGWDHSLKSTTMSIRRRLM